MSPRIVFGVMSATQSAAIVDQLCGLLAPHRVVVHHDFAKRADFVLSASNARIIADPRPTGWGTWGFSDAILHTVEHALAHYEFDYFQLLSPTCLPLRPLAEFEHFVASDRAQAHADCTPVDASDDVLMTFGYRTFAPGASLRMRVLRKLRGWYFGEAPELVQTASLSMLRRSGGETSAPLSPGGRLALAATRLAAGAGARYGPFGDGLRPMIGGVFFGARRHVCQRLVRARGDTRLMAYVRELQIVDETLFPTLLWNLARPVGPANHAINAFTGEGSPRWIDASDLDRLHASGRFFARKFVDDPRDPTRLRTIERVAAQPGRPRGAAATGTTPATPATPATARRAPSRPRPRLMFALMSSQQPAETVQQLVDALRPHPVLVHHDFTKRPDFRLTGPHVSVLPDPCVTGWGTAGFVDGIFHVVDRAVREHAFDYLQLLSPTCLPIRPIDELADHVAGDAADIHADLMPVEHDDDVLMTFAYRTFVSGGSLRFRLLRRARKAYFGPEARLVQTRSLSILQPPQRARGSVGRRAALALTRHIAAGSFAQHPYGAASRPMIGSVWFGARRAVCEHLLRMREDVRANRYFGSLQVVDETVVATMLAATGFPVGPSNHSISPFDEHGHPTWIDAGSLQGHFDSGRFFARKFPEDPASPVRARAIARARVEPIPA
jgi:hypothetical protein